MPVDSRDMPLAAGWFQCSGVDRKLNWLLVREVPDARRVVVFFPGDISDFAAGSPEMDRYSLEALMWVLCCKFLHDTIVLVKPRHLVNMYAAYVNFMLVDGTGTPQPLENFRERPAEDGGAKSAGECTDEGSGAKDPPPLIIQPPRASLHLTMLLSSLEHELSGALPETLVLVGFSKGASVLNACLREAADDEAAEQLWRRCEALHFVDAGLGVPKLAFPVGVKELQAVASHARPGFLVWLHGTPRQMKDPARPYIAEEAQAFLQRCGEAGLQTERRLYCEREPPSLNLHFDSLRCFQTEPGDTDCGDQHCGFFASWGTAIDAD